MWDLIKPGLELDRVLDLACGQGGLVTGLADHARAQMKEVHGVDFCRETLEKFARKLEGRPWTTITHADSVQGFLRRMPGLIDLAGSRAAFYVISKKQVRIACQDICKCLDPQGVVLFGKSFVCKESKGPGTFRHKWDADELAQFLEETGITRACPRAHLVRSADGRTFHFVAGPEDKIQPPGEAVRSWPD
jgi:SAM-dependent methyltransferase